MGPGLDGLVAWLMRPRVRRVRRWSFVLTVPVAAVLARIYGVHEGVLVIGVRAASGRPNGPVQLPLDTITSVEARTERVGDGRALSERDGAVPAARAGTGGRVAGLAAPVNVQRPLHEPLSTRRVAVASDDPERLVERLLQPSSVRQRRVCEWRRFTEGRLGAARSA